MLKSSLSDYSDAYRPVKGTIMIPLVQPGANPNKNDKKVLSKNCRYIMIA